jgi:hypothetical protein
MAAVTGMSPKRGSHCKNSDKEQINQ